MSALCRVCHQLVGGEKMNCNNYLLCFYCLQKNKNRFDTPQDYISYLANPDLSVQKIYSCMESLRIALTNNPLTWVHDFVNEGLKQVLNILNECYRRCCKMIHAQIMMI